MSELKYRPMQPDEIFDIGQVNRQETVRAVFVPQVDLSGLGLVAKLVQREPPEIYPPWDADGAEKRARAWASHLVSGGLLYGAFAEETFVGFVLLGPQNEDHSGEIVALFVDTAYRWMGIAGRLMVWAEEQARTLGMETLYLYSNQTESAVRFYQQAGFGIVGLISKEVVSSLPGDIIMAKKLKG